MSQELAPKQGASQLQAISANLWHKHNIIEYCCVDFIPYILLYIIVFMKCLSIMLLLVFTLSVIGLVAVD
jgi:hypothetical protein